MEDNAHLLHAGGQRRSSSDGYHRALFTTQQRTMTSRGGNKRAVPSLTSPLVTHYCLTFTTAVFALTGFVGALVAALSCEFLRVQLSNLPSSSAAAAGWIDSLELNSTDEWYYNELSQRTADHTLSIGIFCPNSIMTQDANDGRLTLSKAFLTTSLLLGALLLNLTCLISTILPNTERLWNIISVISGLGFLCELPVFFVLDSQVCTGDFVCSLGGGSFGLFCSMVCYLVLALLTQWRDAPDWREEYELWKLVQQNNSDRAVGERDLGRDVELGMPASVRKEKVVEKNVKHPAMPQVNAKDLKEDVPPPPPPLPDEKVTPPTGRQNERRLAKQTRLSDTSNFVGTYINVGQELNTPDRGTSDVRNISPITLFTLSKDGSSAVETGAETEVHKNTQASHDILNSSMELINQQLQKSLEMKRNLIDQQKQREEQHHSQQQQIEDISQLSFLDYNDLDANVKTFQQAPFGKDSFDNVFYADMPDLSSIMVSNDDEDDASNFRPPANQQTRSVSNLLPAREAAKKPKTSDDASVAKSVRSASTRSTLGRSVKSIFRKKAGKENTPQNRGRTENKEMIREQWMLDENSLGMSNSDDLLFLVERNREDGASASQNSRRSKVTALSWASRCKSPDQRKSYKSQRPAVVSPTLPQINRVVGPRKFQMPSEITTVEGNNSCNVVSPEKDDPGVEMYPSDASMSTLSLPTGSDYYTSDDDRRSKSSRKDTNSYSRGFSSGTDSEAEEMSIIIAGVQRMNRKTCGKPSHLSKKRRRRRKKGSRSGCSISEYSSHSGSLLDEVIDEEGELNESGEPIPAVIDASPIRPPRRKSSKSPKKKTKRNPDEALSDAEHSGYESGYACRSDYSDNESKNAGYRILSENEESTSSRAARARRNRLLSKRQIHIDPDTLPGFSEPVREAIDASGYKSPANSSHSGSRSHQQPRSHQVYKDSVPLMSSNANIEGCFGSTSQRGNLSWQARNSRMSRLRMQRQAAEPSVVRDPKNVVTTCGSDEGSI
ncbi:hypothetical protein ACHAXN_011094 [Cyclotella atomus]